MYEEFRSIPRILAHQNSQTPDRPAILSANGDVITYGQLYSRVRTLAAQLRKRSAATAQVQTRFGIVCPNGPEICQMLLAASFAGTAVPFDPKLSAVEFEARFQATKISVLVILTGKTTVAEQVAQRLGIDVFAIDDGLRIDSPHPDLVAPDDPDPNDVAVVLMTSGSTGRPKIVPLTHRNLCRSAQDVVKSVNLGKDDRCLTMWEQYHIGGVVDLLLAPLLSGGSLVAAGSFSADKFFKLIDQHAPTWYQGVPTSLVELVEVAKRKGLATVSSELRFIRSVAAALSPNQQRELEQLFGVPVVRTLGMTEASPLITSTGLAPDQDKPGSVGRPAGPQVAILNDEGAPLSDGKHGEVAVRGENVFSGYEDDEQENMSVFRGDWFLTGDLGYVDTDGYLFLTGRKKDLINRGGEKISPAEVDTVLLGIEGVLEAASFAIPHRTLGEDIGAAVTLKPDVLVEDIRRQLSTTLAPHKIPSRILQMDRLLRNPTGKIDRLALAGHFAKVAEQDLSSNAVLTRNQKLVMDIWKRELSQEKIGLHQDFAAADGDSLSAVRILVELERIFNRTMPDELVEKFSTIAEMADCLDQHGFVETARDREPAPHAAWEAWEEQTVFSGDVLEARRLIEGASSKAELRLLLDHMIVVSPASDVQRVLTGIADARPGYLEKGFGVLHRMTGKSELERWVRSERQYVDNLRNPDRWQRESIAKSMYRFGDPNVSEKDKTLIVGFGGNRMRLLMPTYRFVDALDPSKADLLLLVDPQRKQFLDGLVGVGDTLEELASFVQRFTNDCGYRRLVSVGTSGGSIAVLVVGGLIGCERAVSVGPIAIDGFEERLSALETTFKEGGADKTRFTIVHGKTSKNRNYAHSIGRKLPNSQIIDYPHTRKNIFPEAEKRGELSELLETLLFQ